MLPMRLDPIPLNESPEAMSRQPLWLRWNAYAFFTSLYAVEATFMAAVIRAFDPSVASDSPTVVGMSEITRDYAVVTYSPQSSVAFFLKGILDRAGFTTTATFSTPDDFEAVVARPPRSDCLRRQLPVHCELAEAATASQPSSTSQHSRRGRDE